MITIEKLSSLSTLLALSFSIFYMDVFVVYIPINDNTGDNSCSSICTKLSWSGRYRTNRLTYNFSLQ